MEQKQKDALWAQYTKQTHRLGRVLSLITVALLLARRLSSGRCSARIRTSARRRGDFCPWVWCGPSAAWQNF